MKLETEVYESVDWSYLDSFSDRTFSQRKAWIDFVCETQGGEPVVARVDDAGTTVGFFAGVIIRRMGLQILGSPFPGWTTPYMGFNLRHGVSRADAVDALISYAFFELGCHHLEISDPYLLREHIRDARVKAEQIRTFRSNLQMTEDELFVRMDGTCRRCIRKAAKSGVVIEEAGPDNFAEEYFTQLKDVFAKQNMRPTYGLNRVDSLIRNVYPTGDLLLLRARDPSGYSIATGIFPGFNKISYFWGNASLREHQQVRPNEAMHWYAMKYWKRRGVHWHYWGGDGSYKKKYGGETIVYPNFRASRSVFISILRDAGKTSYYIPRNWNRRIFKFRSGWSTLRSRAALLAE
jgi:hypothetical protein